MKSFDTHSKAVMISLGHMIKLILNLHGMLSTLVDVALNVKNITPDVLIVLSVNDFLFCLSCGIVDVTML